MTTVSSDLTDRLDEAVNLLAEPRTEYTTITDDDGKWLRAETVELPSLIETLLTIPGGTKNGGSADPGVPIDADALEIMAQIKEHLSLWSRHIRFDYSRHNLIDSLTAWHKAHTVAVRLGHMRFEAEQDMVRTVESWVRMIQRKFAPDNIDEVTAPCPLCGVRRVTIDDNERFAVRINWTQVNAQCSNCAAEWVGETGPAERPGLRELRYMLNIADTPTLKGVATT